MTPTAGALNREWRRDYERGAVGAPTGWEADDRLTGFDRAVEALATVEDPHTSPVRAEEVLQALAEHAARGDVVAVRVVVQCLLPSLVRVAFRSGRAGSPRGRLDELLAAAWEVTATGVELRGRSVRIALLRTIEYRALGRPARQARRRADREILVDPVDLHEVADLRGRRSSAETHLDEVVVRVLARAARAELGPDDARLLGALSVGGMSCGEMAAIEGVSDRTIRYRRAAALRRLVDLAA